ncbi:uncharacterized protein LOC136089716 [Hydra vulgaris]|uniref:Uncharacterized protein LOC136089716 n=1 Tax=Hydra vulgaris TaxID=6087 RepID=A0ABM4DBW0_HYDVU
MATETWFNAESMSNLDDFNIFRKDRINGRGGGVCIYTRKDLIAFEINSIELCYPDIEKIWCGLKYEFEKILVGWVYRPPNSANSSNLCKSILAAKRVYDNSAFTGFLLTGDFNYPNIKWVDDIFTGTCSDLNIIDLNSSEFHFKKTVNDCFLSQNVFFPTFQITDKDSTNILDLIFTEKSNCVSELTSNPPLRKIVHPHMILTWNNLISANIINKKFISSYIYKKGDNVNMLKYFNSINWKAVFEDRNINQCYEKFLELSTVAYITNLLNTNFQSVFTEDDNKALPSFDPITHVHCENDINKIISLKEILIQLKSLDKYKSCGNDGVHPFVLSTCSLSLSIPIEHIFKLSLKSGVVPKAWKDSNIITIF